MPTIGEQIKTARQEAGFKNRERLAVELDVSMATIARWESGKTSPSVRSLIAIATVTGKPLSYFVADEVAA